jgi:lipopolysaccharide transport system permease protein
LVGVCVRLILVIGAFLWFEVSLPLSAALAIAALFALIVFGFAVGLLLAPLATLYHDLLKSTTIVLGVWLFVSPVLYPVPRGPGLLATVVHWNPVTPLLVTIRELATGAPLTMLGGFVAVALLSLAGVLLAWIVYRLALPYVIERLSA